MANELTLTGSLSYSDSESADLTLDLSKIASVTTKIFVWNKQNIGITEEAINLGEVSSLGWAIFVNRDATNFIELRTGTGATKFAKLKAGEFCVFRFGSGITAPYAIADTAACQMEYIIISA